MLKNQKMERGGFTLIEMMLVVGLIGLFASMFRLSFSDSIREAALDASYASVITALESARGKAIAGVGTDTHGVHIDAGTVSQFSGPTFTTADYSIELSPSITVAYSNPTIIFNRISGESSTAHTITLTDSQGNTRTITITPQGHVY